jgi:DNA-binding response OmpR family regulator
LEKKRIYIAEDFPLLVELLKNVLKMDKNLEPTFFDDGLKIYMKVLEDPPDILLLDIILPSLSGLAVCRLLKFHDKYKSIPVIVTSSITDHDIEQQALRMGANAFLPKPFDTNILMNKLLTLLDESQKIKSPIYRGILTVLSQNLINFDWRDR